MIRLEGDIDITGSAELKATLVEAICSRKQVQVELELATDFDVTAVQLLWAAAREAIKNGTSFTLCSPNPGTAGRAARDMGLPEFLLQAAVKAAPELSSVSPAENADDR